MNQSSSSSYFASSAIYRAISNYINVEDDLGDLVGFNNGPIANNSFYN
jgi:hypothetical protein